MSIQVKINDIIDEMDSQIEEYQSLLNLKTGQIIFISSDDLGKAENDEPFDHLPKWQQEDRELAIDILENPDHYVDLPTKFDIHEYQIIENFCLSINDQQIQNTLLKTIRGKGAFRRFKDKIIYFGIEDHWYSYRDEQFKQIAIDWCEKNGINYVD